MRQAEPIRAGAAVDWPRLVAALGRVARGLARDAADADDLVQQTLASLLARHPERAGHFGYARRTLVRLWLDQQRAWRRRLARYARLAQGALEGRVARDAAAEAEQAALARRVLAGLPPRQRAALVLRVLEGLEYAEIAELLECSVESVRANLHVARERVRARLGVES
jgi:RNA polymerase sigma factor (sigma-70 family)